MTISKTASVASKMAEKPDATKQGQQCQVGFDQPLPVVKSILRGTSASADKNKEKLTGSDSQDRLGKRRSLPVYPPKVSGNILKILCNRRNSFLFFK